MRLAGLVGVLCLVVASSARAQEDIGVFQLFVNMQPKGDVFARQEAVGDYWVKVADLRAAGLAGIKGETKNLGGELHVRLSSLQDVMLDVSNEELTISITAKADALGAQTFSLATVRMLAVTPPSATTARYNYRIGYEDLQGESGAGTLENRIAVWSHGWLFQYQDSYRSDLPDHNYVRQGTNFIRDWPERMQRLNIGDITALSGELGTTRTIGGIGFSRVFDTQPGFVSNPTASFIGNVALPSTAEIYVDGVRISSQRLNPGTYQFNNLDYYGGLRNTEIVIRDPYGGRQVLSRSVYFTDQLLKRGLQDYSYNIGVERQNIGTRSNDYSGRAYSLYHRYGVDDTLTVSIRSDGNSEAYSAGPGAALRLGNYGIVGGTVSLLRNAALDENGKSWLVRHTFDSLRWSTRLQLRWADRGYNVSADDPSALALPHRDSLVGVGYTTAGWGRLSFNATRSDAYDGSYRNANTLGYSVTVRRQIQLFSNISRVRQSSGDSWEGFMGASITWEGSRTASLTRQRTSAGNIDTLEHAKSAPEGQGYGYRLALTRTDDGTVFEPFAQLNTERFIFTGTAAMVTSGEISTSEHFGAAVSGAIVMAGGEIAMTRPVQSSFALVKVGELEGVRVYRNNQEAARTDARGVAVVPTVTSYAYNSISIEPQDIALDYNIGAIEQTVVPPLGAGVLARFDVRPIRAYEGKLRAALAQGDVALEHVAVTLTKGSTTLTFTTGFGGDFYLDSVEPGDYDASFSVPRQSCNFRLHLPKTETALTRLDTITARCSAPSPR